MPEALQQVRDDLGENAVILNTRQIRRNSRFNPHEEARVEVTAACDETALPAPGLRATPLPAHGYASQNQLRSAAPQTQPHPAAAGEGLEQMRKQLNRIQETLTRLERRRPLGLALPQALERLAQRLYSTGLGEEQVDQLAQQLLANLGGKALEDRDQVGQKAAALLRRMLPPCKHIKIGKGQRVVGFFGSSGSGKTTAAAKIAAGFALKRSERIALVTADDRRVGGLDQARAFAHSIGVPLEVAGGEEEMGEAMAKCAGAELVLIDAPGCGPHDLRERDRQQRLFAAAGVHEVQVVIDALSSVDHMLDVIEASQALGERRLLFTKVDESRRPGALLSAAMRSQVPTSYMTLGPQVPGQIETATLGKVVDRIVGVASGRSGAGA